jgi:predicted lipid-binding transport protein (Tim44 family)
VAKRTAAGGAATDAKPLIPQPQEIKFGALWRNMLIPLGKGQPMQKARGAMAEMTKAMRVIGVKIMAERVGFEPIRRQILAYFCFFYIVYLVLNKLNKFFLPQHFILFLF